MSTLIILALAAMPVADASPTVPYCGPASADGASSQTAGTIGPEACMQLTGRVFPEALEDSDYLGSPQSPWVQKGFTCTDSTPTTGCTGFARDYVGYFEFQAGLNYLASTYPDLITVHEVAMSAGLTSPAGEPERNPIYILEISNKNSPIPRDDKLNLLFMLSIHGNEKGGREGGFRVLEDLTRNIGFATETVQNGAGFPGGLTKPTGGQVETYFDYLDFMNIFLLFPNTDGWVCDEAGYGAGGTPFGPTQAGGGCGGQFMRVNGNGQDLNRQTPTIGWQNAGRQVLSQPEAGGDADSGLPGFANWLIQQRETSDSFEWDYAIDIHGMINHQNFGAIMLPAGSMTPQEMFRSISLAELLKNRWNADAEAGGHFEEWGRAFETVETAWRTGAPAVNQICAQVDCPGPGSQLDPDASPSEAASSSQFAEYYTVIDAIGYTDSGFNGDFFAQSTGLNAPGYDIELAYNHLNCGAAYQTGVCAQFNDYHVWMVRHIVKAFMDQAAFDVQISYETNGARSAYVVPEYVATNLDDVDENGAAAPTPGGWADQTTNDDAWDYGSDTPFEARPAKYWEDIAPFVCENCGSETAVPGVLQPINPSQMSADQLRTQLANFDNLVIPNTAINQFVDGAWGANEVADGAVSEDKINVLMDWVSQGGNLVLTDAALEFFDIAGLTEDGVEQQLAYMGGIRMDLTHPMLEKVRGGVKQTYEPTPMGWGTSGAAPNWGIDPAQFLAIDGASIAGFVCGGSNLGQNCDSNDIALGYVDLGTGRIQFMGAILPDPTEEFYHPYGLDDYATTYSGNQVVRNMMGWDEVFSSPPVVITDAGVVQSDNERDVATAGGAGAAGSDDESDNGAPGAGMLLGLLALAVAFVVRRK